MSEEKIKELSARLKFTQFLEARHMRKTSERFAILDKLFSMSTHVDVDTLYRLLLADEYHVSLSTVYSALSLFVEAGLARPINLGDGVYRYERVVGAANHHHLICIHCGKVKDVKAVEPVEAFMPQRLRSFEPSYYSLYIYGSCSRCARQKRGETKVRIKKIKE